MASHFFCCLVSWTHGAAQDQSCGLHGAGIAVKKEPLYPTMIPESRVEGNRAIAQLEGNALRVRGTY
jgi:hypothetical protein